MPRVARLAVGIAIVVAVVANLIIALDAGGTATNYFSYFTILSNVMAAGLLIRQGTNDRTIGPGIRGAVTLYMAITGVIYVALLRNVDVQTVPWVNVIVHYLAPAAIVADWFLDRPERRPSWATTAGWLAWPAVYVAYTLIRGPIVDWYPYPFLDPREQGYAAVAGWAVAITLAFVGMAGLLRLAGRSGSSGPEVPGLRT